MDIEVCVETFSEAEMAAQLGAKRIELCTGLDLGGLTPSHGLISACSILPIETHVLIRPRGGDFCYSSQELDLICTDIEMAKSNGAEGVVVGVLNKEREVDQSANQRLVQLSKSLEMEVTFHRAFDLTSDPIKSLNQIIELGFDRILTSGQQPTAIEGLVLIRQLVDLAKKNIQIMAGSGVSKENAKALQNTGIDGLHFSSRIKMEQILLNMGFNYVPDSEKILSILNAIKDE